MLNSYTLAQYIEMYGESWADEMPDNCPPENICISSNETFYRYTENEGTIVERDWLNHINRYPNIHFEGKKKILAAGLSLQDDLDNAKRNLKLPLIKKKYKGLAAITLVEEDGVLKQTTNDVHHYTWWRTNSCNLTKAKVV